MRLYLVGIGPGKYEDMTLRATEALDESDYIAGYKVYCDLLKPYYPDKKYIETPMTKEAERVEAAYEKAKEGHTVSLVCSGDSGVYGMAGLACAKRKDYPEVELRIIPGVTAALSGGAVLGAPLIHDFAVISLSDRLTPMGKIEKRLRLAAEGDMAIVIYNPESKGRAGYLSHACDILLEICEEDRVCGYVKNIGREGECFCITTLKELKAMDADMFTTVFIGNPDTKAIDGMMVTPRGYKSGE